jgi:hypothetical protein
MPKKKGDKGGNPNPVRPPIVEGMVYIRNDKDPYPDVPMTKKLQIWMYAPVVERLNQMPPTERILWLRKAIAEAAIKDLGVEIK